MKHDVGLTELESELVVSLKELRDACAAAMRVLADCDAMKLAGAEKDSLPERFGDELERSGVNPGFGVRAQSLIDKAEKIGLVFAATGRLQ